MHTNKVGTGPGEQPSQHGENNVQASNAENGEANPETANQPGAALDFAKKGCLAAIGGAFSGLSRGAVNVLRDMFWDSDGDGGFDV